MNGRDRYPDAFLGEGHTFAGPDAGKEMLRMVVDARAACGSEQESRGLQGRVSDTLLEWNGDDVQFPDDRSFIPDKLVIVFWLQIS